MINKKILVMFLFFVLASFPFEAFAGELVWGPQKYVRGTGAPVTVTETFTIERPAGRFWLFVENGGAVQKPGELGGVIEPVDRVSSAYIKLNGVQVVGPNDLNQQVASVTREDLTLYANNIIEVEVRGKPGSYITVSIRREPPNPTVSNKKGDLIGGNMQDQIGLWWSYEENANEYVVYKAYSIDGPWTKWLQFGNTPPYNIVDSTPEAKTKDLCYRIEALDSSGTVIRLYEPICVPKWQEEESSLPLTQKTNPYKLSKGGSVTPFFKKGRWDSSSRPPFQFAISSAPVRFQLASSTSPQSCSPPQNGMCLSDDDFTNNSSMSYEDIKKLLEDNKSFLKDKIKDVDGVEIDPADIINLAALLTGINPQVLLTTLQKEFSSITNNKRPADEILKLIMGYGSPSTIREQIYGAAGQMRRDFDKISNGGTTISGWGVGITKPTGHFDANHPERNNPELDKDGNQIYATPASKVAALLFSYTPWAGKDWGGIGKDGKPAGGNALFCEVWKKFKFIIACKSGNAPPLSISGPDNPTDGDCYSASGGAPTYTWSIDKGSIDTTGKVSGLSNQCGTATVTVKDACGATQSKVVTLSTAEITISGPDTATDGAQYTASRGKAPYTWSITKGSITQAGIVTVSGQCGTATITVTDACGATQSKVVTITPPVATISISGPDAPQNGSQYTASGGTAPYTWSITKGSINSSTGVVTVSGQCGTATITVQDACGNQATKDVRMPNGRWVLVSRNLLGYCRDKFTGFRYDSTILDTNPNACESSYHVWTEESTKISYSYWLECNVWWYPNPTPDCPTVGSNPDSTSYPHYTSYPYNTIYIYEWRCP